jgi:bifunctional non-homologous end joining protein LigD
MYRARRGLVPKAEIDRRLIYAGSVGTGWSIQLGRSIMAKIQRIGSDASPFVAVPRPDAKDARWTEPQLVAEGEFYGMDP